MNNTGDVCFEDGIPVTAYEEWIDADPKTATGQTRCELSCRVMRSRLHKIYLELIWSVQRVLDSDHFKGESAPWKK